MQDRSPQGGASSDLAERGKRGFVRIPEGKRHPLAI
jgi:hypothetical protein